MGDGRNGVLDWWKLMLSNFLHGKRLAKSFMKDKTAH
jgi:hypothetical protein